ncbi:hypothetical protein MNBD_PLANCTO02-761 [hydrothermal vent metagenome]|uniref:Uncharacterized protein n=1 Tax=hydrothermal vent metagenome TaxID=652676 RepID=A0A3B1DP96_9ZZZZ
MRGIILKFWVVSFLFIITFNKISADSRFESELDTTAEQKQKIEELDPQLYKLISMYENFAFWNWNENRRSAIMFVEEIGRLNKDIKSSNKFLNDLAIPLLIVHLDFRRTRIVKRQRFRFPPKPSLYPVTDTLIKIGQPVIQPLLKAVGSQPRSSIYLLQARLILKGISTDDEATEKIIAQYIKFHPKESVRILRLSKKFHLKPLVKKEELFNSYMNILERRHRQAGMSSPTVNKENIKVLKKMEELISESK